MNVALRSTLGILVGLGLTWLVFRDTPWQAVSEVTRNVRLPWLGLAIAFSLTSNVLRVARWRSLLVAIAPVAFSVVFRAAQIGALSNVLLPLRMGEAVRPAILSRSTGWPFLQIMVVAAIDRIVEVLALAMFLLFTVLVYTRHEEIRIVPGTLGNDSAIILPADFVAVLGHNLALVLGIGLVALALLLFTQRRWVGIARRLLAPLSARLAAAVAKLLANVARGLGVLRSRRQLAESLFFALAAWGSGVAMLAACFEALALQVPWQAPFLTQATVAVLVIAPLAPGLVGQFHAGVTIGLILATPDLSVAELKAAALVSHAIALGVLVALGVLELARSRTSRTGIPPSGPRVEGSAGGTTRPEGEG